MESGDNSYILERYAVNMREKVYQERDKNRLVFCKQEELKNAYALISHLIRERIELKLNLESALRKAEDEQ